MAQEKKSFLREQWTTHLVAFVMFLVVILMTYFMTTPGLTAREVALSQVLATVTSIGASYLITKAYAERSSDQTLRDHGVQIASGIMVLRRRIDALSDWVAKKRTRVASDPTDSLLEHVEETLDSFRDMTHAALGGIAQVIGDALNQYEAVMEQISNIRAEAQEKTTRIQADRC